MQSTYKHTGRDCLKKFIKGRWFPLIVAIGITAVVAFVMALFGWRITYVPDLENCWDAVSAVAAWAGVFVAVASATASFLAVWFAIRVPNKIADRQDRIALFDKRYCAYSSLLTLQLFSHAIDKEFFEDNTPDEQGALWDTSAKAGLCCLQFATVFGYHPQLLHGQLNAESVSQTITILKKYETELYMLPLLFKLSNDEKDEMGKEISGIFEPLFLFMTEVTTYNFQEHCKIEDKNRQEFIEAINSFSKKYAEKFESELKI